MDQRNERTQPLTPALRSLLGGGPTAFFKGAVPLRASQPGPVGPVHTQQPGSPLPLQSQASRMVPILGQQAPAPAAPAAAPVKFQKCPGPIQMPDDRVIEPGDYLTLNDICEIMPFLLEAMGLAAQAGQAKGLAPGQRVPVVGQPQGGAQPVPTMPGFGPAQGPFGGGGGAMFGGGGGGPGPKGDPGMPGPAGPPGPGALTPPVSKTDGDFTAGPGAFVPVPGTTLSFTTSVAGPVIVLVQAELNSVVVPAGSQSDQLGLRIDGVDYKLARRVIHTFIGGVGEFFIGQAQMFSLVLPAGPHTVDVLLRALLPGEYGVGIGTSATVSANPDSPLVMAAIHG